MDELTPLERHLIDEAVTAGRVQPIPQGRSAIDPITGRYADETAPEAFRRRGQQHNQSAMARRAHERRMEILNLADGTRSCAQIMAETGLTETRVTKDLYDLRHSGHAPKLLGRHGAKD